MKRTDKGHQQLLTINGVFNVSLDFFYNVVLNTCSLTIGCLGFRATDR